MDPITATEVNAFLPKEKWQVDQYTYNEPQLNKLAVEKVLGKLKLVYPDEVQEWREGEAPKIVRSITAMHLAAWIYSRQFSEDATEENSYANWLLKEATRLLDDIIKGLMTIENVVSHFGYNADVLESEPVFNMEQIF